MRFKRAGNPRLSLFFSIVLPTLLAEFHILA